ncbi:hypothetical protein Dimus_030466 [Dionaea muscipula]
MVGNFRGTFQQRAAEDDYESWSPVRRPVLFRGSPSPRPRHYRREPPSPGMRSRRRSPSPMLLSSSDPAELSSSEEGEDSEAAVTLSDAEVVSDLENGQLDSSHAPLLSPIPECKAAVFGHGDGGEVSEVLCSSSDKVSISPALLASCGDAFVDGSLVQMDVQIAAPSLLQVDHLVVGSDNPLAVGIDMPVAGVPILNVNPLLSGHNNGGGLVSEEGQVLPVAREALRPQPTDGLRQPSSAPVEPVSGVEGEGGLEGCSRGRSYAHVVQVDRWADVELSYLPPVDGGNTIFMEESDGDTLQWGSCLVGHFL